MHRLLVQQARSCWSPKLSRPVSCTLHLTRAHSIVGERRGAEMSPLPFQWMKLKAPEFRVNGDDITVLHEPSEFYNTIKENIGLSRKRIILASLYLGNGPMEQDLVKCLHDACERAQDEGDDLNVHVLLDCVRGSRGQENSRTMLLPLVQEFGRRVSVSLYHTPELRGFKKAIIPERFNEAIGLSHLKVYAFDDTLLMSGANLSDMYFTNRQDRYVLIKNCPELVGFFSKLVLAVSSLAFQLHPDNSLSLYAEDSIHPVTGDLSIFKLKAYNAIQYILDCNENENNSHLIKHWQRTILGSRNDHTIGSGNEKHRTIREHHTRTSHSDLHSPPIKNSESWNNHNTDAGTRTRHVTDRLQDENSSSLETRGSGHHGNKDNVISAEAVVQNAESASAETRKGAGVRGSNDHGKKGHCGRGNEMAKDTAIFPLVQMGPLGITADQEVTRQLLGDADEDSACYLASGYFNLTSEYMDTILDSRAAFEMLMASPQVNGFYGSRGISGYVPDSYTFISRQFHRAICGRGQRHRIRLYEYYRDAWTFHVKGLWYYLPNQNLPSLTLIGSPNFGYRSVHRDLEAQLAIVTKNTSLRNQLHQEQQRLYARSEKVDEHTFAQPARRVPLWARLVTTVTRTCF